MARTRTIRTEVREWLRAKVATEGVRATATALDLADATILRAAGDLPVQLGTVALLDAAFARAKRLEAA